MPLLGSFTSQIFTAIAKAKGVSLQFKLNNPDAYDNPVAPFFGDEFGNSVAVSGNYAIVGSYREDEPGGTPGLQSGKAYIFNVTSGALVHTLNNPNAYGTVYGDFFGCAVAISGNYAIVGANGEESTAGSEGAGSAYIFNVTTGALVHTLRNPNVSSTALYENFGQVVAISGNYAIVSNGGEAGQGGNATWAYIFNVTTGALVHTLNNPNAFGTIDYDFFGNSIAISGNYAIVGACKEDEPGGTPGQESGKAYIFNVTTGALVHTLNNPNAFGTSEGDFFGLSVAISGNYAIVGAYNEDDAGGTGSGKAYIFNVTSGALVHTLNNPNAFGTSLGDWFGASVAISDNYAIVGANGEDAAGTSESSGTGSGKAYIFNVTTGALVHILDNPNTYITPLAYDSFGEVVAISGNYAIVGAPFEDTIGGNLDGGKAYIYKLG